LSKLSVYFAFLSTKLLKIFFTCLLVAWLRCISPSLLTYKRMLRCSASMRLVIQLKSCVKPVCFQKQRAAILLTTKFNATNSSH